MLGVGRLWSTTQRISRTVISPILENRREKVGCLTFCLWLSWSAWFVFHLNVGYSALPVGFLFALLTVIGDSLSFHLTSIPFNYCILMLVFVSAMLSTFCMLSVLIIVLITHLRVIYFVQLLRNDYSHNYWADLDFGIYMQIIQNLSLMSYCINTILIQDCQLLLRLRVLKA